MRRRPYPHAAYPAHEPRDWEQQRPNRANGSAWSIKSGVEVRSDPSLLPLGAVERKPIFPKAPPANRRQDSGSVLTAAQIAQAAREKDKINSGGPWNLLLGELENQLPRVFRPFFEFLRGRYQLVASPSAPTASWLSLPGCIVNVLAASLMRWFGVALPSALWSIKQTHASESQAVVVASVSVGLGLILGALARNWFGMNHMLCSALAFGTCVRHIFFGGKELLLLGLYIGTWIRVETKYQAAKKEETTKPLREGPQPADWVHDRWLPGEWEIQLPGGWSIFPDAAQKQLEKCFQQQAREATLQVGDYGEYQYRINFVDMTALNLGVNKAKKTLIRRSTQN